MNSKGFTLIELLIVIAIIGILAAVLIPQLLGARTATNKRAIQSHSANIYKTLTAIYAEDTNVDATALANAVAADCLNPVSQIIVGTVTYQYGWTSPPRAAVNCTILPNATASDFIVTVTGDGTADGQSSLNGRNPS